MPDAIGENRGVNILNSLASVLFFLIGLHLPKAFTLLYVALLVCAIQVSQSKPLTKAALPAYWRWSFLGLSLFSIVYLGIMLYWGFASPHGSGLLDCISALVLPAACFWIGLRLTVLGRATTTKLLLAYGLGALLYVVAALASVCYLLVSQVSQKAELSGVIKIFYGSFRSSGFLCFLQNVLYHA